MKSRLYILLAFALFTKSALGQTRNQSRINNAEIKILIDSVSSVLSRTYIYPEKATLYSKKINNNFKAGVYNKIESRSELGHTLLADLQETHKDIHLKMAYWPEAAKELDSSNPDSVANAGRSLRLAAAYARRFWLVKSEILPGNIGYVRWDGFDEFEEEALKIFDSVFQSLANTKVLILDFRYNIGGNASLVNGVQNYFFEKRTALNHLITRSNDTIKRYTDPLKTNFKLKMPVYILTSRRTVSGAEDMIYIQQQIKRAVTVGDTTWGGAHSIHNYSLGQGFVISVPVRRSYNEISKSDWEIKGISPNVYSDSELALSKALELIYTEALSSVKDEGEKRLLLSGLDEVKKGKYIGQPFTKTKNVDAPFAIEIKDSIYGPTNVGIGNGVIQEYHVKTEFLNRGAPIYIKEQNSAWFKLTFSHDTLLTFDLVPIDGANDYDFIIFRCSDINCVENIRTHKIKPDRECHSGFESFNGATGLSEYSTTKSVGLGPGNIYASALPVKAGETYYLMILYSDDYVKDEKPPHGFTLYFHDYWPKKKAKTLNNVNFNSNDTTLLKESFVELDKLVATLKKTKSMSIEIRGHADTQGSDEKNLELSQGRAEAVKTYLCSKGIDPKRIVCKGYGSSKPLTNNDTEEGRKKNRRVEFAIIMK